MRRDPGRHLGAFGSEITHQRCQAPTGKATEILEPNRATLACAVDLDDLLVKFAIAAHGDGSGATYSSAPASRSHANAVSASRRRRSLIARPPSLAALHCRGSCVRTSPDAASARSFRRRCRASPSVCARCFDDRRKSIDLRGRWYVALNSDEQQSVLIPDPIAKADFVLLPNEVGPVGKIPCRITSNASGKCGAVLHKNRTALSAAGIGSAAISAVSMQG